MAVYIQVHEYTSKSYLFFLLFSAKAFICGTPVVSDGETMVIDNILPP